MKNYCLLIILAIFTVQHTDAAEQLPGRRMPTQAGPAVEGEEKELKERDAQKQEQDLETPEELVALWMAQRQQELQEQERVDEQLFEPKRFSRKPQKKHYLSELGGAGALREFRKIIQQHFESVPIFKGISKNFRVRTGNRISIPANNVAISPDGRMIAVASSTTAEDGFTGIETTIYKIVQDDSLATEAQDIRIGHDDQVQQTTFIPNKAAVALQIDKTNMRYARGNASKTYFFQFQPRSKHFHIKQRNPVSHLVFSPDGSLMATAAGNTVTLYNTFHNEPIQTLVAQHPIQLLAFSPDGSSLGAKLANNTTMSWSTENWQPAPPIKSKIVTPQQAVLAPSEVFFPSFDGGLDVTAHAVSATGTYLAAGLRDGSIRLWNRTTGDPRAHVLPTSHAGAIIALGFWPDAPYLTAITADGTVTLWNIGALEKRRDAASRLLKQFLSILTTREERMALRTAITNGGENLKMLLHNLSQDNAQYGHQVIAMVQQHQPRSRSGFLRTRDDFTVKNLESPEYQGHLFSTVAYDPYKFLDSLEAQP